MRRRDKLGRIIPPNPRWTPEKVALLRQHWDAGMNVKQIAALFDTTWRAIIGAAHRHQFPRHVNAVGWKRLTPEQREENRRRTARNSYARRVARIAADPLYAAHRKAVVQLYRMRNADELREKARERDRHRIRKPRGPRPRHDPKRKGGPPIVPYVPRLEPVPDTVKTFLELRKDDCRWVIGEPDGINTRYCGANMVACSYCAKHYRMAYQPGTSPVRYYRPGRAA